MVALGVGRGRRERNARGHGRVGGGSGPGQINRAGNLGEVGRVPKALATDRLPHSASHIDRQDHGGGSGCPGTDRAEVVGAAGHQVGTKPLAAREFLDLDDAQAVAVRFRLAVPPLAPVTVIVPVRAPLAVA